jgi:hypothetical protein
MVEAASMLSQENALAYHDLFPDSETVASTQVNRPATRATQGLDTAGGVMYAQ